MPSALPEINKQGLHCFSWTNEERFSKYNLLSLNKLRNRFIFTKINSNQASNE